LPCFAGGEQTVEAFRGRFQISLTDQQAKDYIEEIIDASLNNVYTKLYDQFQYYSNGIFM